MVVDKFNYLKDVDFEKRDRCMVCGNLIDKSKILSFSKLPLTEIYVDFKNDNKSLGFLDQSFYFCEHCKNGQLLNIINPAKVYNEQYFTRTSSSYTGKRCIDNFYDFIIKNSSEIKSVTDIGCNDLYALKKFKNVAEKLVGVDPILKGDSFYDEKIKIYPEYIENIELDYDLDTVISSHTIEHIPDPLTFLKKLIDKANVDTNFFFQFPSLDLLIKDWHFEQIFHQHLNYLSFDSFKYMLSSLGCEILNYDFNKDHWGTLMVHFKKSNGFPSANLDKFQVNYSLSWNMIEQNYSNFKTLCELTNKRIKSSDNLVAFGAALMLPLFAYHIDALHDVKYIYDDDVLKKNLYYINFPKRIITDYDLSKSKKSTFVITALTAKNALRSITKKLIDEGVRDIIIPNNLL